MNRRTILKILGLTGTGLGSFPRARGEELEVGAAEGELSGAQYNPLSCDLRVSADYENPYDPAQVTVDARVTRPDGRTLTVPAFYLSGSPEDSRWQFRFTPRQPGQYRLRFVLKSRSGRVSTSSKAFTVSPSERDGFVGLHPSSVHFFRHDSGKHFRGVGENIANIRPWSDNNSQPALKAFKDGDPYAYYFKKLSEVGANVVRKWIALPGAATSSIEYIDWPGGPHWSPKTRKKFERHGPGRFDQDRLAELDTMFESADRYGIYIILCLHSAHNFKTGAWRYHPFNRANGGPCEKPEDFLTHPEARRLTRNKLRYLVARYGHSPHLLSWEFWNECNSMPGADLSQMVSWHRVMCDYMRRQDPYNHLLTTSISGSDDYEALWSLDGLDVMQVHSYDQHDMTTPTYHLPRFYSRAYDKPCVVGEFGIKDVQEKDPRWLHLHRGLWQSTFARAPVGALNWFREHIDADDQYFQFEPVAQVNRELAARGGPMKQLRLTPVPLAEDGTPELSLYPARGWTKGAWIDADRFTASIRSDGTVKKNTLPYQLKPPYRFVIHAGFSGDGTFTLFPRKVRGGSPATELIVRLDGDEADRFPIEPEMAFDRLEKDGEKIGYVLEKSFTVPVPSGHHTLSLCLNRQLDYAAVDIFEYHFRGLGQPQGQCLWPHALRSGDLTWMWLERSRTNWKSIRGHGKPPPATKPVPIEVPVPSPGRYTVQWIDTFSGETRRERTRETQVGKLQLTIPPLTWDIACRIEAC